MPAAARALGATLLVLISGLGAGVQAQSALTPDGIPGAPAASGLPRLMPDPPRGASALARATRIATAPTIDGVLDEPFWATLDPIADFVQRDPVDGAYPTERTEVRIAYDEGALYFGFTLFDSDPSAIRAHTLNRGGQIGFDDHIVIALDTFNDRRNGYIFEINALGTQDDAIFTDESIEGEDWNWDGVYRSETRITADGWVLEVEIPFTTIRFPRDEALEMGLLIFRSIRRKNETAYWPHLPVTYRGRYAQASQYGTLVGLEGVTPGRNLQVKPFIVTGGQKAGRAEDARGVMDLGLDVKYSLSSSLTLDLTWNTDFAQVEADNVQVNLDRFSLFFPEKREFFLERARLFAFGDPGQTQVFFSRRIGLENPIVGGGRLTGQVGRVSVGVLNLQTGEDGGREGGNNSVARVRADLGPRASIGGLVTNLTSGDTHRRAAGADAQFRFFGSSSLDVWAARLWDPDLAAGARDGGGPRGLADGQGAASAHLRVRNARYGTALSYTNIGRDFLPALGFVRRPNQQRIAGELNYSPRFERSRWARQWTLDLRGEAIEGQDRVRQSERRSVDTQLVFQSGDAVGGSVVERVERLVSPFSIRPGVLIAPGDYTFTNLVVHGRTNGSRRISGNASVSTGSFYHGTRTELRTAAVFTASRRLSVLPAVTRNVVSLPVEGGRFTTNILEVTVKSALNRSLFGDALIQYDDVSRRLQANIRVNWIHTPGSNLFLVLDTGVNMGDLPEPGVTRWERRTGVVKLTYLWAL
ncbi:MAG: DUF5916 domain-containing protein [Vicinamibacterales bacterium]|nr:DUF5916 domain-containing protein [Vicinamibacterales bacterium]